MTDTLPTSESNDYAVQVDASVRDERTGALYVHRDLDVVIPPWALEEHVGPPKASEALGDVDSWVEYITRFATPGRTLLTWNSNGLYAILDYHENAGGEAGRVQWLAKHPFIRSPEWHDWTGIASGHAVSQAKAIEFLEDHGPDIVEPTAGELMNLLRSLRGTVNKTAETTLNEDGSTRISFEGTTGIAARGGTADLPAEIAIAIPVLKGHVDDADKAVLYRLAVRLRASVDDHARLALRFSIPAAERTLEDVFADRVREARQLLVGEGFDILRAAG